MLAGVDQPVGHPPAIEGPQDGGGLDVLGLGAQEDRELGQSEPPLPEPAGRGRGRRGVRGARVGGAAIGARGRGGRGGGRDRWAHRSRRRCPDRRARIGGIVGAARATGAGDGGGRHRRGGRARWATSCAGDGRPRVVAVVAGAVAGVGDRRRDTVVRRDRWWATPPSSPGAGSAAVAGGAAGADGERRSDTEEKNRCAGWGSTWAAASPLVMAREATTATAARTLRRANRPAVPVPATRGRHWWPRRGGGRAWRGSAAARRIGPQPQELRRRNELRLVVVARQRHGPSVTAAESRKGTAAGNGRSDGSRSPLGRRVRAPAAGPPRPRRYRAFTAPTGLPTMSATSWDVSSPKTRSSTTVRWSGVRTSSSALTSAAAAACSTSACTSTRPAQPLLGGRLERLGGLAPQPATLVEQPRGGDDEHPRAEPRPVALEGVDAPRHVEEHVAEDLLGVRSRRGRGRSRGPAGRASRRGRPRRRRRPPARARAAASNSSTAVPVHDVGTLPPRPGSETGAPLGSPCAAVGRDPRVRRGGEPARPARAPRRERSTSSARSAEVIVVDDGSRDGTAERGGGPRAARRARRAAAGEPRQVGRPAHRPQRRQGRGDRAHGRRRPGRSRRAPPAARRPRRRGAEPSTSSPAAAPSGTTGPPSGCRPASTTGPPRASPACPGATSTAASRPCAATSPATSTSTASCTATSRCWRRGRATASARSTSPTTPAPRGSRSSGASASGAGCSTS